MSKSGGAAARATQHINRRVTQSGFRGFDYATAIGSPLNRYVVLHLRDDAGQSATTRFGRVRHKYRDWLARKAKLAGRPMPPIYVYSFENPSGSVHVNWAVHVPPGLESEFERKLAMWVGRVQEPRPGDLHVQPIDPAYSKRLAKYLFKGTDPVYVRHFHLDGVHKPQGSVFGRRAGISQAIGIRARKRAAFHPGRRSYGPPPTPSGWRASHGPIHPAPEPAFAVSTIR